MVTLAFHYATENQENHTGNPARFRGLLKRAESASQGFDP
jgi:hypothetical protein